MKRLKLFFILLLFSCETDCQTIINGANLNGVKIGIQDEILYSYSDLVSLDPPTKYIGNPILTHDATYTNIAPASKIIDDPNDATKILFYVGEFPGNTRVNSRIALYTASKLDPYKLTRYGVVVSQGVDATYKDQNGAGGICGLQISGGTIYLYYTGIQGSGQLSQSICLATSTDGRSFTKVGQVLAPNGTTEWNITDSDVSIFDGTWYMYYTAKSNIATPQPTLGIKIASSVDGVAWTRTGSTGVTLGGARDYDGKYIEGAQVVKIGSDYVMLYTSSSNSNIWSVGVATRSTPDGTFTKATVPFFQHGLSGWDSNSATVGLLSRISNRWYFFYQGSEQFQPATIWDIGGAELTINSADNFPCGFLANRGNWTGECFFGTTNLLASSQDRVIRALDNTGFTGAYAESTIDVTPGVGSSVYSIIRINVGTGDFRAGFYLMEGSSFLTGIYFHAGNISHLRNTGWATLQAYSASTNYEVEVLLTSTSTYSVKVNGSTIVSGIPLFTNVVTKANKFRVEKSQASTATAYYADIKTNNLGAGYVYLDIGQK